MAVVDCAEPSNRDARNEAWALSGKRAVYPQLFTRAPGGALAFVGDWDAVQALSESNEELKGLDAVLSGLARLGDAAGAGAGEAAGAGEGEEAGAEAEAAAEAPEAEAAPEVAE